MRDRERILGSLEDVYRDAFEAARKSEDPERMARLDFDFQKDQIYLEVLLDVRDLLLPSVEEGGESRVGSLLDKAKALKNLTRLKG